MAARNITIGAGTSCFTQCHGCYNFFGKNAAPVSTSHIVRFLQTLPRGSVKKITVAGADPLSREDIVELLRRIHEAGFDINLDTVGTAFLGDAETIFFGSKHVKKVRMQEVKPFISLLGIPLDGASDTVSQSFRLGRAKLVEEQRAILEQARALEIPVCINTVVTPGNVQDLPAIFEIINAFPNIVRWQVFQFMPIGQLGYRNRSNYLIPDETFAKAVLEVKELAQKNGSRIVIEDKSCVSRKNKYFFVDSDGIAWIPASSDAEKWGVDRDSNGERKIIGNISNENELETIVQGVFQLQQEMKSSK